LEYEEICLLEYNIEETVEVNRRFGEICRPHLQGQIISQEETCMKAG
jgi:hypothetical protein